MKLACFCLSLALASISFPLLKKSSSPKSVKKHAFFNSTSSPRGLLSSSSVTNYQDFQYYAQATIGTPPQTFTFTIDTGSTWIWIDSNSCSNCHSGTKFYSSSSFTFYNTQTTKTLTYLQGNSVGYLSTDVISIGESTSLSVTNQSFILVYNESSFGSMKSDGLIGFAFDSLSDGVSSLLTSLKTQGKIKNRQFAIYLSEDNTYSDLPNLGSSNLMIDGYNLTAYSSENIFTYVDLANSEGYWEIPCDAVYFDGKTYSGSPTAIVDTGTSVIIGPKNDVNSILLDLYYNYGCKFDSSSELYCSCTGTYPNMTFQFSGHNFTLQPSDYFEVSEGYCFPALYYSSQLSTWLLGDSFIRRFYINFDMDEMRIGFAKVGISTSTSSSSSASGTSTGTSGSGQSSSSSSSNSASSNNSTTTSSNSTSTSSPGSSTSSNTTSSSNSSSTNSSRSPSSSSSLNGSSSSSESFETWKIVLIVVLPLAFFVIVFVISAVAVAKIIKRRKQKRSEIKLSGNIEVKIEDAKIENKNISNKNTMEKYEEEVVRQELNRNHHG